MGGSARPFFNIQQLYPYLSKLNFEKRDYTVFFLYEGPYFWMLTKVKDVSKISLTKVIIAK
jgi:hypothetical protein